MLASQDLDEESADKRPSVQIGDPFTGKKLLECSLELARSALVVSLQDLGAAGLASSLAEMAASGEVGLEIELDAVPLREAGMQPFEIMISESQERMAAVVEPSRLAEVQAVCARHELPCTVIGTIIDGDRLVARFAGETVGDLPVDALTDAPTLRARARSVPTRSPTSRSRSTRSPSQPTRPRCCCGCSHSRTSAPRPGSTRSTTSSSARAPSSAPAATRPSSASRRPNRAIAVSLDGDGARVALDPRRGGHEAVAQAVLNVACSGADPAAITNCLNFGNPERPATAYALREAITGMAEACEAFETPVVSGNVSLYNEHSGSPDPPDAGRRRRRRARARRPARCPPTRRTRGAAVLLLGAAAPAHDGSERQALEDGAASGRIPEPDARTRSRVCATRSARPPAASCSPRPTTRPTAVSRSRWSSSAWRSAAAATSTLPELAARGDITLFGESCGNVLVTCAPADAGAARRALRAPRRAGRRARAPRRRAHRRARRRRPRSTWPWPTARAAYEDTLPLAMEPR